MSRSPARKSRTFEKPASDVGEFKVMLKLFSAVLALFLMPAAAFAQQPLVAIDAGHGGFEQGIAYTDSANRTVYEKDIALSLAKALSEALEQKGIDSYLLRDSDVFLGISDRAAIAEKRPPTLFVSLHLSSKNNFNVYTTWFPEQGGGPEDQYLYSNRQKPYLAESRKFAAILEGSLKQAFSPVEVVHIEMPLPLLNEIAAPAVMVETPYPASFNYSGQRLKDLLSSVIANSIDEYSRAGGG